MWEELIDDPEYRFIFERGADYVIEPGAFGPGLSPLAPWSQHFADLIRRTGIKELHLNHVRGFSTEDLTFLEDVPCLEALHLLMTVSDPKPVYGLPNLRRLSGGDPYGNVFDFRHLPSIEELFLDWGPLSKTATAIPGLRLLSIYGFSGKHAQQEALMEFQTLRQLMVTLGGKVKDLGFLSAMPELTELNLNYQRGLVTLEGVQRAPQLESLGLVGCHGISNIEPLRGLKNLSFIGLENCGKIDSLAPLEGMMDLERLDINEDTDIVDGDLSVLTRLPKLREVWMSNRRHYSHRRELWYPFRPGDPSSPENLREGAKIIRNMFRTEQE